MLLTTTKKQSILRDKNKTQFEESKQRSEPETDMRELLDLSGHKYRTHDYYAINFVNKIYSIQKQMDNVSREREIIRIKNKC